MNIIINNIPSEEDLKSNFEEDEKSEDCDEDETRKMIDFKHFNH